MIPRFALTKDSLVVEIASDDGYLPALRGQ